MATVDPSHDGPARTRRPNPDSIATLLRQARERRGLTLEEVARETKVPLERLAALEQFGLAGGSCGFYQRARIRAFARAVDLNDRDVLEVLEREAPPPAPAPEQPRRTRRRSSPAQHVVTLVACGVIVAGISRMVWDESGRGAEKPIVPTASSAQAEAQAAPTSGTESTVVQPAPLVARATLAVTDEPVKPPDANAGTPLAAPAVPTELVIITEPADARVAVDGIGWGSTPVTIHHLSPGEKRIRVTKDGYLALERIARVVADRSTTVDFQLQPAP